MKSDRGAQAMNTQRKAIPVRSLPFRTGFYYNETPSWSCYESVMIAFEDPQGDINPDDALWVFRPGASVVLDIYTPESWREFFYEHDWMASEHHDDDIKNKITWRWMLELTDKNMDFHHYWNTIDEQTQNGCQGVFSKASIFMALATTEEVKKLLEKHPELQVRAWGAWDIEPEFRRALTRDIPESWHSLPQDRPFETNLRQQQNLDESTRYEPKN